MYKSSGITEIVSLHNNVHFLELKLKRNSCLWSCHCILFSAHYLFIFLRRMSELCLSIQWKI